MGSDLMPQSRLRDFLWGATWLSKLLRHSGNRARWGGGEYGTGGSAYGKPADSGGSFRWEDVERLGSEAIRKERLTDGQPFCKRTARRVLTIGDANKDEISVPGCPFEGHSAQNPEGKGKPKR